MHIRHLLINTRTANTTEELDNGDLSSESTPHASQLETDDTTTDDDHLLRDLLQVQGAGRAHDLLLVNLDRTPGEGSDLRSGRNDDVLALDFGLSALVELNADARGRNEGCGTLDVVDFVLLEQDLDTLRQATDGILLGLQHLRKVQRDAGDWRAGRLEAQRLL